MIHADNWVLHWKMENLNQNKHLMLRPSIPAECIPWELMVVLKYGCASGVWCDH